MSRELGIKWLNKETWDFDVKPSAEDFGMFTKAILICANGDGRLATQERQWVVGFAAASGAPDEMVDELKTWEPTGDHKALIESRMTGVQSKRSLIYFAIAACSADGEYHAEERDIVHKVAERLDIPKEVVAEIEALYKEERALRQKRLKLLFDIGKPF